MSKEEQKLVCPECSGKDFITTSKGTLCTSCKQIVIPILENK